MSLNAIKPYFYLMRFHKPIGILLLLWPTLWALWLACDGHPPLLIVCVFILGVIVMRAAGCIINDVADRHVDGFVARTAQRPLATKTIQVKSALILFACLLIAGFLLVLLLNPFTIKLAFVGALLAIGYPFLKRITHLPQLGLGVAFSWGIPMAFAATTNAISGSAWIVFLTAVIWPVIYDTLYAMTDRQDDLAVGIKSTAILFGRWDRLIIAVLQCVFVLMLVWVGHLFDLKWPYYVSVAVVVGLFMYQQWLIKDRIPARCFQAFLNNHWVGMSIFIGIVLSYENCCG